MPELTSMKYAELRKLAKKAGIKANVKHDKLITNLTQYYEKNHEPCAFGKHEKAKTTPTQKLNTLVLTLKSAPVPKTPVQKISTPVQKRKSTSVQKAKSTSAQKTPVQNSKSTPVQRITVSETNEPLINATAAPIPPAPLTPSSKQVTSRWTKKVFSPLPKPGTAVAKVATPVSKSATPAKSQGSGKRSQSGTPISDQPVSKKRRSTFEAVPTPDLNTPEIDKNNERRRSVRGTTSASPGVREMLGAMKSDMNAAEMKKSLLSAIDKNVHEKAKVVPAPSSGIPRFAAFLKKRDESKPVTPGNKNWNKIHRKNFDKFDSIDVYLDKKRKRAEEITTSVKKAKHILDEVHTAVDKLKSHKTPQDNENKFKKPRASGVNKTTPFKPSVFNTNKLDLKFGAKKSPKTLPRKSPKSVLGVTTKTPSSTITQTRKSTGSVLPRKSSATPFKFTAVHKATMNTTIASTKKTTFDLKASLARPLSWRPHKGKLMPVDGATIISPKFTKDLSTVKVKKGRNEIKANVAQRRANKKQNAQMARRGINV